MSTVFSAMDYLDVLKKGLKYVEDRRSGHVKSFITPWKGLNRAGLGGLEWGSMLTIGARPGAGKTMFVSELLRESRRLNPDQDFSILEFQFEMGPKQYAARQFAAEVALDYNQVLSTDRQVEAYAVDMMKKYILDCEALQKQGVQRKLVVNPLTVEEINEYIIHYYKLMGSKPMIVTIDHSWLIKKDKSEKDKMATLYNTVEMLMQLKRRMPIIILMITQLNRTIEDGTRRIPGTIGNYPTSNDIFGGDALMQGSDMVIALSRPHKLDISIYGHKKYIVDKHHLYMHLIKIRNGKDDNTVIFLNGEFDRQKMVEISEPVQANKGAGNATNGFVRFSAQGQTSADV